MRNDVKVGLVLSLVVVVVAGWYFVGRGQQEKPLAIGDDLVTPEKQVDTPRDAATPKDRKAGRRRPADRPPRTSAPPAEPLGSERATGSAAPDTPTASAAPEARPTDEEPLASGPLLSDLFRPPDLDKPDDVGAPPVADSIGAEKPLDDKEATAVGPAPGPGKATPIGLVGRAPKPVAKEPPAGVRTHVIGPGDTLAILAEIHYGSQSYADYLMKVNPGVDPRRLRVGTKLLIPEKPGDLSVLDAVRTGGQKPPARKETTKEAPKESKQTAKELPLTAAKPSGKTYTVKPGDSLCKIARTVLGDESRWREILEANKGTISSPDRLRVGQVLQLPAK
ncbi:MAG: LysM peptidoglycan-binding domain-containing protein [Phycisphaerales bacterium]|nr:MAG: LysM peptidoglycan-binding domain-containing protein [Phycisphaerales bacterium]